MKRKIEPECVVMWVLGVGLGCMSLSASAFILVLSYLALTGGAV